jgi:nicotinate-nucleotide pyrophosphorylase
VELPAGQIEQVVRVALAEDLGSGDLTTEAVVPVEALSGAAPSRGAA